MIRIYDQKKVPQCKDCQPCCPVADLDPVTQTVTIHDPDKPENGRYTMTVAEYNILSQNLPPVSQS